MKKILPFVVVLGFNFTMSINNSFAGSEGGGGGDASEARVNEIRSDILSWINKGGASGLKLSIPLSLYETDMRTILQNKEVSISFTDNKVEVEGKEKTCRGYFESNKPHMLCNIARFEKTTPADQYRLIHHEYAGLALVEKNQGSASDYEISNQITDFLKEETVLRLSLKGKSKLDESFMQIPTWIEERRECHKLDENQLQKLHFKKETVEWFREFADAIKILTPDEKKYYDAIFEERTRSFNQIGGLILKRNPQPDSKQYSLEFRPFKHESAGVCAGFSKLENTNEIDGTLVLEETSNFDTDLNCVLIEEPPKNPQFNITFQDDNAFLYYDRIVGECAGLEVIVLKKMK